MRFRLMFGPLLVALVVTLAFMACGGDDDDGGGATGDKTPAATEGGGGDSGDATSAPQGNGGDGEVDACTLVTADEASAALGASVGEGASENFPSFYGCRYETEGFEYLSVTVVAFASGDEAKTTYEQVLDINDYPKIDGLGDRAYDTRPIGTVTVQKGKYEVSVDILTLDDDADFEVAKDLARKAIGRLP